MRQFEVIWKDVCAEETPSPQGAAGELVHALSELLDVDIVEYATIGGEALFLLDLGPLGFKGMDVNVLMLAHPPRNDEEADAQIDLLRQYKTSVESWGFCFYLPLTEEESSYPFPFPEHLEAVFLTRTDLQRLFSSKAPSGVLFEVIRRQVHLEQLCPFNTTKEARGGMFRGRNNELAKLIHRTDTNFLVCGARRIGKTSLLKRAYNTMRVRTAYKGRVFFFNCLNWKDQWDCFNRLCHVVDPKKEPRIEKSIRNISYLFERASFSGSKPLVLFLDELDGVVDIDSTSGWPFFSVLAEAAAANFIRVVFAGYRSMDRLAVDENARTVSRMGRPDSPFHGSLEIIHMEPLSHRETQSLIQDPFHAMQVPVTNSSLLGDKIWEATKGHPFLIQFFGERIFQVASSRDPQEVRPEDVDGVMARHDLAHFLEMHFLDNTLEDGSPIRLERQCAFVLAHRDDGRRWKQQDFQRVLQEHGISVELGNLVHSLDNLVKAHVFTYTGEGYAFTFPPLKTILRQNFPDLGGALRDM